LNIEFEIDFTKTLVFMTNNMGIKQLTEHIARYQSEW